jgi:hypothetical protein
MSLRISSLLALALLGATPVLAVPDRPACDADMLASTRAALDAACPCDMAETHGQYVSCAAGVIKEAVRNDTLPRECRRALRTGASRSTCGKPEGFVTCCRERGAAPAHCSVKRTQERCERVGRCVGATVSCLDACDAGCGSPSGAFLDLDPR